MRRNKGQVLLFIFFLLAVVGFLAGALSTIWEAKVKIGTLQKSSIGVFYLAQAGVERAKYELKDGLGGSGWSWAGIAQASKVSLGDGFYWVTIVDDPADATYNYRTVTGFGELGEFTKSISVQLRQNISTSVVSVVDGYWVEN